MFPHNSIRTPVPVYEATYPADFTHSEYNFLVRRGSGNSCRYILRAPGQREQTRRERGVCVIVGEILVEKEMVLTVDY